MIGSFRVAYFRELVNFFFHVHGNTESVQGFVRVNELRTRKRKAARRPPFSVEGGGVQAATL
jgi:hypothetical protein